MAVFRAKCPALRALYCLEWHSSQSLWVASNSSRIMPVSATFLSRVWSSSLMAWSVRCSDFCFIGFRIWREDSDSNRGPYSRIGYRRLFCQLNYPPMCRRPCNTGGGGKFDCDYLSLFAALLPQDRPLLGLTLISQPGFCCRLLPSEGAGDSVGAPERRHA